MKTLHPKTSKTRQFHLSLNDRPSEDDSTGVKVQKLNTLPCYLSKFRTVLFSIFAFAALITATTIIVNCTRTASPGLIQLKLLSGDLGDLEAEILLSDGTPNINTLAVKHCGVFPPPYEIIIGGTKSTAAYTITIESPSPINPYEAGIYTNVSLVLSEGGTKKAVFPSLTVTTSDCTAALAATALAGTGTESDPYLIDNGRRLNLMADLVNSQDSYRSAHYRVTKRIDLGIPQAPWSETYNARTTPNGAGFNPIGPSQTGFGGTFDCDNNEIANLYVNIVSTEVVSAGLFGYASNATIRNCRLRAVKVIGNGATGGLAGASWHNSTINNSYVTGDVRGGRRVGGLVGYINSNSTVSASYMTGSVVGNTGVGGLIGYVNNNSTVSASYMTGTVTGVRVGGLVGYVNNNSTIMNSYAAGSVTRGSTPGEPVTGGLVGSNRENSTISNSYATGSVMGDGSLGGLVAINDGGVVTSSYWDITTTGQSSSAGEGTGQTTEELQSATSYLGWEDTIWEFAPNNQYPRLKTVVCANRQYTDPVPTDCTDL